MPYSCRNMVGPASAGTGKWGPMLARENDYPAWCLTQMEKFSPLNAVTARPPLDEQPACRWVDKWFQAACESATPRWQHSADWPFLFVSLLG